MDQTNEAQTASRDYGKKSFSAIVKKIDIFYGIGKPNFVSPFFGLSVVGLALERPKGLIE